MALTARLLGRGLLSCGGFRSVSVSQCRAVTIQPKPAQVAAASEGHDERNMRLCRPQSPHLTIYQIQLTSTLSITHRFTGMLLSGYAATFATVSLLSKKPMLDIIQNISHCYPNFFLLFKFGLIFPFTYHFFNGIRHLMWDSGNYLSNKGVYTSGYAMLVAAGVSGALLMFMVENVVFSFSFFIWDTGKMLTIKGVYVSGYTMLLLSIISFAGIIYLSEELKRIERELELKRQEEAARLAALQEEEAKKKKKKKKLGRGC